jgi:hypothetical protein
MKNAANVYLKKKNISNTFNVKVAIRNVFFGLLLSAFYLLARHYYSNHSREAAHAKINTIKRSDSNHMLH